MRAIFRCATALLVLIAAAVWCAPADAQKRARAAPNLIRITYAAPANPAHREIHDLARERRILERFREILAPIRFPRLLELRLESCDGEANAWYEDAKVSVCYEYIAELVQHAPRTTTREGITRESAIVGPVIEVFLHEIGHAVFDMLKVPIFGREEDAADQFAAFILLQLTEEEARMTVRGVAYMYAREALAQSPGFRQFASAHGLSAQRLVNLLCLAHGARPEYVADAVEAGVLPPSRAEGCAEEYRQVTYAFRKLIQPHVDVARAKKVRRTKLLR